MATQSLADEEYQYYASANNGTLPGPGSNNSNPMTIAPLDQDGVQASAKAAAPAAAATVTSITIPQGGTWDIYYDAFVDGSDAVGDVFNMGLYLQGALKAALLYSTKLEPKGQIMLPFRIKCNTSDVIAIKAIANATASTNYYGLLSAIRVR